MKKLTASQKKKRSLLRQQVTQLKRLAKMVDAMEKQGYEFKKGELRKIFKASSERASVEKIEGQLDKLKGTKKAGLYNAVKSFAYTSEGGRAVKVRGPEAVSIGKKKTRKKKKSIGVQIETPTIDITDLANDSIEKLLSSSVLVNPEVHSSYDARYGDIRDISNMSLGKLIDFEWRKIRPIWSAARGGDGQVVVEKCTQIIRAIEDATFFPSIGGYKGEELKRVANIVYTLITDDPLPAQYTDITDDMSPIGTPWESYDDFDELE